MRKLQWVDTDFDKKYFTEKLANLVGQVLKRKAFLNIGLLAEKLEITKEKLGLRLRDLGYREIEKRLEDLSLEQYTKAKYGVRPNLEEYPARVDCSSLVCGIYAEFGIELPRYTIQQIEIGERIDAVLPEILNLETGDLLFFDEPRIKYKWKSESGIEVSHVMLYLGEGRVADASVKNKPKAVVIRNVEDVGVLGRRHVATRRYIKNFDEHVLFENCSGVGVEDFDELENKIVDR